MMRIVNVFMVHILIIVPLFSPSNAVSGEFLGEGTRIERIRLYDGYAIVYTQEPVVTAECSTDNTRFYLQLDEGAYGNHKYSTALAAFLAGKPFNPWCRGHCVEKWGHQFTVCQESSIE